MADYVKFSVPEDLKNLQADVISKLSKSGKIKVGINEVTKMVERNTAKLVLIAEDISPAEIVMHLPVICKEKNIAFSYVSTKEELGKVSGINAKASAIAIVDEGVLKKEFSALISKIEEISGVTGKSKPAVSEGKPAEKKEKPAEKKPVVKKEKPVEVKKEEPKVEEKKEEPAKKEEPKVEEKKEEPVIEEVAEENKE